MLWYPAATAVPSAVNFLLAPLLIRLLGQDGFSEWAILEPIILIGAAVMSMGVQYGVLSAVARDRSGLPQVFWSAIGTILVLFVVVGFFEFILIAKGTFNALILALLICQFTEATIAVVANVIRGLDRPEIYALSEISRSVGLLSLALSAFFITDIISPVQLVTAKAVINSICVITTLFIVINNFKIVWLLDFNQKLLLMSYGVPIFLGQILILLSTNIDRYAINFSNGTSEQISTYVLGMRLAGLLNLSLVAPLSIWFPVAALRRIAGDNRDFFTAVSFLTGSVSIILSGLMSVLAPVVWPWLFPGVKFESDVITFGCIAVSLQAMAVVWNVGALKAGRTGWNIAPTLILFVLLAATAVPAFQSGGLGLLSIVRTLGFLVYAASFLAVSVHLRSLAFEWAGHLWLMAAAAVLAASTVASEGVFQVAIVVLSMGMAVAVLFKQRPDLKLRAPNANE